MKREREETTFEELSESQNDRNPIRRELSSLTRSVSPPPTLCRKSRHPDQPKSTTARVEAGEKDIEDHLAFFSTKLLSARRTHLPNTPRLDHQPWVDLYTTNANNPKGHHFVVHQHDHPIAGTHYDLRLQCNATSSVSWAIMYGLPGDPNSRRLNRNATETRVHCLWNHLVETGSHQTGSLLIWDTGVYEVLPYHEHPLGPSGMTTDEEASDLDKQPDTKTLDWNSLSELEKLHRSFQHRRICVRLHGTRLPENYTVKLWLRSENDRTEQPAAPKSRRWKGVPSMTRTSSKKVEYTTDSEGERDEDTDRASEDVTPGEWIPGVRRSISSLHRRESPPPPSPNLNRKATLINHQPNPTRTTSNTNTSAQDELTRKTNAYPGSKNTIHSIHQRKWYLSLDTPNSGFSRQSSKKWVRRQELPNDDKDSPSPRGFTPFHVLGRECEKSVVTGRLAGDVLCDEGVVGFVGRAGWRGVVE